MPVWLPLLLVALLLRAIVPQGYMASADETGSFSVEICNSDAVWTIPLAENAGDHGDEPDGDPGHCAFAGQQLDSDAAGPVAVPVTFADVSDADPLVGHAFPRGGTRIKPPSRGPPVTV